MRPIHHKARRPVHPLRPAGMTCVQILQPGYKVGERIVRPARVAVAEPEEGMAAPDEAGLPDGAGSQESREDED